MKIIKIVIVMAIWSFLLAGHSLSEAEEVFPRMGFAKNDGANVRAGDNINFESLCRLKKGDTLKVVDKRYSWYNIILPKEAYLYIKNVYVELDPEGGAGTVNALRVNLRSGPDERYSISGQASRPEKLIVLSEEDGWYKIEPPDGTRGWIHSGQIGFSPEATIEEATE